MKNWANNVTILSKKNTQNKRKSINFMETWGLAIIFILFLSWTHVFLLCGYIYLCLPRNQRYRGNKPAFCLFLSFFL